MFYMLWHTPRVGSNLLCNLLHQTGVAGIADYERCGFFVGFDGILQQTWEQRVDEFIDMQTTSNGVSGMKGSFKYFDDLKYIKWNRRRYFLDKIDRHIILSRMDKAAQAVSLMFGATQANFEKRSKPGNEPAYDYGRIAWKVASLKAMEYRMRAYVTNVTGETPPTFYYEDTVKDMRGTLHHVVRHVLGIEDDYEFKPPTIQKQYHPLKAEYVDRFWREAAERKSTRYPTL